MADATTVQAFDAYADQLNADWAVKKQELMQQIQADPSNTSLLEDYGKQQHYVDQINAERERLDQQLIDGLPIDDSFSLGGTGGGALYYTSDDPTKLKYATCHTFTNYREPIVSSDDFNIVTVWVGDSGINYLADNNPVAYSELVTGAGGAQYQRTGCHVQYVPGTPWMWDFTVDYIDTKEFFTHNYFRGAIPGGYQSGVKVGVSVRVGDRVSSEVTYSSNTPVPIDSSGFISFGKMAVAFTNATVTQSTDDPWDYYNDTLLPTITPGNGMQPYEPGGSDTPGDEPQNLPHDDGEPPENQTDRALSVPMNFITQYVLDADELMTVGANLWQSWLTPNTDVWKNFFLPYAQDFGTLNIGACMDCIISLRVYPFEFTLDMFVNQPDGLRMGTGHTDFLGTSVPIIKTQIYCLDMGTCEVKPVTPYNDFRDMYNTSVLLFLPYCGSVELNPAEVIGRTLHAYYFIDFQSGGCTAVVTCVGDAGEYNIASKSGQIGFSIPLTATNAGQLAAQTMKDAVQTVGTIGGLVFDIAKNQADNFLSMAGAFLSKPNAISEDKQGNKSLNVFANNTFDTSIKSGESAFNAGLSLANQALDRLSRSGIGMPMLSGGSGAEAMMFPDCVSIQIRRGKYAKPVNYPHSQGHLNGSSGKISEYAGAFTGTPTIPSEYEGRGLAKFTGIDTTGLTCHADERAEIVALLESGIYI